MDDKNYWLELPLSRTYFHGSKGVRAIEDLLHINILVYTLNVNLLRSADSVSSYSEHSGAEALSEHVFSFLKLNLNHFKLKTKSLKVYKVKA